MYQGMDKISRDVVLLFLDILLGNMSTSLARCFSTRACCASGGKSEKTCVNLTRWNIDLVHCAEFQHKHG